MHRVMIAAGREGRAPLAHLLAGSEFEVVASAAPDPSIGVVIDRMAPDLVLVDLEDGGVLPRLLAAVLGTRPSLSVVVLADAGDQRWVVPAVAGGAKGFLLRERASADLLQGLRTVIHGGLVIDPAVARHVVDFVTRGVRVPGAHGLSRAEERVLAHLPDRLTNREIGDRVGISKSTVKTHLRNVYRKLDVSDRFEAAMFATEHGLA